MYTATEVATERHVFEALKHGIDILWIGARTTANPFAVQEIANAERCRHSGTHQESGKSRPRTMDRSRRTHL